MNLNLVVDTSNFKPFDYNLALKAILNYNTGYEKSLAVYDKISLTLGDLASAVEGSDKAKQLYDEYQKRFNSAANEFYSNGMNINTAKELGLLRLLYGTQIRLLEKANENRVKAAEYLKAKNKDDLYMHELLGTLDDWMNNPNKAIRGYSGTLLTSEVAALSKAVGQSIASIKDDGRLDPYTKKYKLLNGFTEQDVNNAITEVLQGGINSVSNPIMREILLSSMDSSGIYNWADEATKKQAELSAARGLYGGIGQTKVNTYNDKLAEADLQLQKQLSLEKTKRQWAKEDAAETNRSNNKTTSAVINPSNIYSAEDYASQVSNLSKYKQYFTTEKGKDGITRTRLNAKGIEEYNRLEENALKDASMLAAGEASSYSAMQNAKNMPNRVPSEFRKFVDEQLGGKDYMRKRQYGNIGNKWNQYKDKDFLKYDATGLTEYNHNIDPSEYKNWKDRIAERSGGYLYKVTWNSKKKQWVSNDNDKVSISDVYANSEPTSTQSSIYGRTVKMVDKDGNTVRYRLPKGINTRAEQNIDNHLQALYTVQLLYTQLDKNGQKRLTVAEAQTLNKLSNTKVFSAGTVINLDTLQKINTDLENALATFESQLGLTNTNKPQEWSPISY